MIVKYNQNKIIDLFYFTFSLAIIVRFINDIFNLNRWGIHSGTLFPYRHINLGLPLYSTNILIAEWTLGLLGAVLLITGKIRIAALLIFVSFALSLTQMFQNQKLLILIIAFSLLLDSKKNSVFFLKWQLILIYLFSSIHKINGQFVTGETMRLLFVDILKINFEYTWPLKIFSWIIIGCELIIPVLLMKWPKIGIALVILFHGGMCLLMPDISSFSLAMISLALLFYPHTFTTNYPGLLQQHAHGKS